MKIPAAVLALAVIAAPALAFDSNAPAGGGAAGEIIKDAKSSSSSHKHTYDLGKIFVIENNDRPSGDSRVLSGQVIDAVSVITASQEKKEEYAALISASALTPGVPFQSAMHSFDSASVYTLDEYFDGMKKSHEKSKTEYEKTHNTPYPFSDDDSALRAELEAALKGHAAVVLRYIHIPREGEKK